MLATRAPREIGCGLVCALRGMGVWAQKEIYVIC